MNLSDNSYFCLPGQFWQFNLLRCTWISSLVWSAYALWRSQLAALPLVFNKSASRSANEMLNNTFSNINLLIHYVRHPTFYGCATGAWIGQWMYFFIVTNFRLASRLVRAFLCVWRREIIALSYFTCLLPIPGQFLSYHQMNNNEDIHLFWFIYTLIINCLRTKTADFVWNLLAILVVVYCHRRKFDMNFNMMCLLIVQLVLSNCVPILSLHLFLAGRWGLSKFAYFGMALMAVVCSYFVGVAFNLVK